jgi:hypothetical protein
MDSNFVTARMPIFIHRICLRGLIHTDQYPLFAFLKKLVICITEAIKAARCISTAFFSLISSTYPHNAKNQAWLSAKMAFNLCGPPLRWVN